MSTFQPSSHVQSTFSEIPNISIQGPNVDWKQCIEKGTGLAKFLAFLVYILVLLISTAATYGIILVVGLIGLILFSQKVKRQHATIVGSSIRISESQFPQIHDSIVHFSQRLGLETIPEAYVIEDNTMNGFAAKIGKGQIVVLTDDIIDACMRTNPQALSFIIAHELGHIAAGHTGTIRSTITAQFKKLSRLDEYTADRIAIQLVGDESISAYGLMLLGVGPALINHLNHDAIRRQVDEVTKNKHSKKAEKYMTHPLLLNRLSRVI